MENEDFICEQCETEFTLVHHMDDKPEYCPFCGNDLVQDHEDDLNFEDEED